MTMVNTNIRFMLVLATLCSGMESTAPVMSDGPQIQDRDYWYAEAQKDLTKRLQHNRVDISKARSIIMFIGDGMSLATITAARELWFQRSKSNPSLNNGEAKGLIWDHFPAVALAQTYNLNAQTGESSACATALLCGVKTNYETLGLDGRAVFENCSSSFGSRVSSIVEWAQQAGKSTGFVTNTRVTHATPAALYAHSPSRYWEDDSKVPPINRNTCKDIALQLVDNEPGKNINVILGGGRRHWLPLGTKDPELPSLEGRRLDGRNLIDDWTRDKKKRKLKAEYVWNREQFENIDTDRVEYLLGLFDYSHMNFAADQPSGNFADPSLLDMTMTALAILEKNPKGFFLMVEGGRIDHAHHYNNPYRALDETLQLENVVRTVISRADLLVVTADHGHVMTVGGFGAPRDHPILGTDLKVSDTDGLPYTTLLYGSGPGHSVRGSDSQDTEDQHMEYDMNRVHAAAVPRQWATHGAEDVPVYAMGPLSSILFSGTFEQSYIPHAVAYIACLGEHVSRCHEFDNLTLPQVSSGCQDVEVGPIPRGAPVSKKASPGVVVVASSVVSEETISLNLARKFNMCKHSTSLYIVSIVLLIIFSE